jgi:hypothetical protein
MKIGEAPRTLSSANRLAMFCALRDGTIEKVLFIGGSNVSKLASSTSMLGAASYKIAAGGWKISKESVDSLLPELQTLLATLPADTPIIIFALYNFSFMAAGADGSMSQLKKMLECGGGGSMLTATWMSPQTGPCCTRSAI